MFCAHQKCGVLWAIMSWFQEPARREWVSNYIPLFYGDVINHPCPDQGQEYRDTSQHLGHFIWSLIKSLITTNKSYLTLQPALYLAVPLELDTLMTKFRSYIYNSLYNNQSITRPDSPHLLGQYDLYFLHEKLYWTVFGKPSNIGYIGQFWNEAAVTHPTRPADRPLAAEQMKVSSVRNSEKTGKPVNDISIVLYHLNSGIIYKIFYALPSNIEYTGPRKAILDSTDASSDIVSLRPLYSILDGKASNIIYVLIYLYMGMTLDVVILRYYEFSDSEIWQLYRVCHLGAFRQKPSGTVGSVVDRLEARGMSSFHCMKYPGLDISYVGYTTLCKMMYCDVKVSVSHVFILS